MARARASTTARGRRAEQLVAAALSDRGWIILGTNIRVRRDELDVVALDGDTLVIVEVRARAQASDGHPLATIDRGKAARLRRAALEYMVEHEATSVRIDVAAVLADSVELVENAVDFTST